MADIFTALLERMPRTLSRQCLIKPRLILQRWIAHTTYWNSEVDIGTGLLHKKLFQTYLAQDEEPMPPQQCYTSQHSTCQIYWRIHSCYTKWGQDYLKKIQLEKNKQLSQNMDI
ncbi:hypothetical protein Pelo_18985 [Pelomyxa schiedti]|nr:hypothetical protein Pelo_18985 [Pelomyxa schiedti]